MVAETGHARIKLFRFILIATLAVLTYSNAISLPLISGPMVGGLLIAAFGDSTHSETSLTDGFALLVVFALDALTFLVSIWALATIRERFTPDVAHHDSILASILDGYLIVFLTTWVQQHVPPEQ